MATGIISTEQLRLFQQNDRNNFQQNEKKKIVQKGELYLFQQ